MAAHSSLNEFICVYIRLLRVVLCLFNGCLYIEHNTHTINMHGAAMFLWIASYTDGICSVSSLQICTDRGLERIQQPNELGYCVYCRDRLGRVFCHAGAHPLALYGGTTERNTIV